jgi:hypothetical protein
MGSAGSAAGIGPQFQPLRMPLLPRVMKRLKSRRRRYPYTGFRVFHHGQLVPGQVCITGIAYPQGNHIMTAAQPGKRIFPINAEKIGDENHQAAPLEQFIRPAQSGGNIASHGRGSGMRNRSVNPRILMLQNRADKRHEMLPSLARQKNPVYIPVKQQRPYPLALALRRKGKQRRRKHTLFVGGQRAVSAVSTGCMPVPVH